MQVLRQLWTDEEADEETRTVAEYVVDLRNRIEDTCQLAREQLQKASHRYKQIFDKKAVQRTFAVGSKVLVLLPFFILWCLTSFSTTEAILQRVLLPCKKNKMNIAWLGPYEVIRRVRDNDYLLKVGRKEKLYHANLLKAYVERERVATVAVMSAVVTQEADEEAGTEPYLKSSAIPLLPLEAKEGPGDVNINPNLSPLRQDELRRLCEGFKPVLTDLPLMTDLGECGLSMTTMEPVRVRQFPLPHSQVETVKTEVKAMLQMGVIEPAASPNNAPIVLVKKKDGTIRFCVDYRRLNAVTDFDGEPMPDVEQLFSKLGKAKFFSKLDLCKGYWQIPMRASDRPKTAFSTPMGQFQWRVMPFGLKTSGAVFTRMMRELLLPLNLREVDNFIDDVLVASETSDRHMQVRKILLQRLVQANLAAKPSKCFLAYPSVGYLGHHVGEGKLRMEQDKVEAIRKAERPVSKKDVRAFIGLCSYYRKFIPNLAQLALPLTDLTKKNE
jgi:hypothetical protein